MREHLVHVVAKHNPATTLCARATDGAVQDALDHDRATCEDCLDSLADAFVCTADPSMIDRRPWASIYGLVTSA